MLAYADAPPPAEHWLVTAEDTPDRVQLWWDNAGIALLATGRQWEVVKTGADRGRPAANTGQLRGPIMCDPIFDHLYFLVPIGTQATWDVPATECLSGNCWLKVPAPHRTTPPGAHWLQPPTAPGILIDAAALRRALTS